MKRTKTSTPKVANKNLKKTKIANQKKMKILRKAAAHMKKNRNLKKLRISKKAKRLCQI